MAIKLENKNLNPKTNTEKSKKSEEPVNTKDTLLAQIGKANSVADLKKVLEAMVKETTVQEIPAAKTTTPEAPKPPKTTKK